MDNKPNQRLRCSSAMPGHQGQRGHPGGRSQGSRRKLTDAFIRVLARDWKAPGEAVIKRVREENPATYFKGMISLLPKEHSVDGAIEQTLNAKGLAD
jgi:hypothetical protein